MSWGGYRNSNRNRGARAGRAGNLQRSAERLRSLSHANETDGMRIARFPGRDPAAVVAYGEHDGPGLLRESHLDR